MQCPRKWRFGAFHFYYVTSSSYRKGLDLCQPEINVQMNSSHDFQFSTFTFCRSSFMRRIFLVEIIATRLLTTSEALTVFMSIKNTIREVRVPIL